MTSKTETPLTDAEELRLAKLGAMELATWTPFARQLEREIADAKEQARLGWERHAEKDAAYQQALNERDQWREVAGRLAETFRHVAFKTDDHWTGEDWVKCDNAIKAYDALAKLSEKL